MNQRPSHKHFNIKHII